MSAATVTDAMQRLLADLHAAVYGYALIGVRLTDAAQVSRARAVQERARLSRDAVSTELTARNTIPVPALAGYQPAAPVTDPAGAQRWATQLQQDCCAGYRYLLSASASDAGAAAAAVRAKALAGLTAAAGEASYWRALTTPTAPTVAFPGI